MGAWSNVRIPRIVLRRQLIGIAVHAHIIAGCLFANTLIIVDQCTGIVAADCTVERQNGGDSNVKLLFSLLSGSENEREENKKKRQSFFGNCRFFLVEWICEHPNKMRIRFHPGSRFLHDPESYR